MLGRLYSSKGRVGRKTYWMAILAAFAIIFGIFGLMTIFAFDSLFAFFSSVSNITTPRGIAFHLAYFSLFYPLMFAIPIRRFHDRNYSGWLFLAIILIPTLLYWIVQGGFYFWGGLPIEAIIGPNVRIVTNDEMFRQMTKHLSPVLVYKETTAGQYYVWTTLAVQVVSMVFFIWLFIQMGFLKGTPGPNRFGPDPLAE